MARGWSKEVAKQNLLRFVTAISNEQAKTESFYEQRLKQTQQFFEDLLSQIPLSMSGPLLSKTPKAVKKKGKRIITIPENDIPDSVKQNSDIESNKEEELEKPKRLTRISKKVTETTQIVKTEPEDNYESLNGRRVTRRGSKRTNDLTNFNAEDNKLSPKVKKSRFTKKQQESSVEQLDDVINQVPEIVNKNLKNNKGAVRSLTVELEETLQKEPEKDITTPERVKSEQKPNRKRMNHNNSEEVDSSCGNTDEPPLKKPNMETKEIVESNETSLYEDAMEKHNLLSSTMNATALIHHKKNMNPEVMLEPLPMIQSNETFVVNNMITGPKKTRSNSIKQKSIDKAPAEVKKLEKMLSSSSESLITDDESYDIKIKKPNTQRNLRSSLLSDDDEVIPTPPIMVQTASKLKTVSQTKNQFKSGALFSPYSKESVKKRVEAFEQVVASSPQKELTTGTMRVTRTKTRALAAANTVETNSSQDSNKDKYSEEETEEEDTKENNIKKKVEKLRVPNYQSKFTTPIGKNRIPVPCSSSKKYTPSNSSNYNNYSKPLTATRLNNLITNVDSFVPKSTSKINSADKSDEKQRRKMSVDDAKHKRDIQLKAMTEEKKKKRELKERKIKEAREAKEKLEMERRMRAEKEREEKAKLALLAQEKAREEAEKKRIAHLQRLQEKEERRKQEQMYRQQKALELEELERQMNEQRKYEQEMEKKRLAEARAYHKAQLESYKSKMLSKNLAQGYHKAPNAYKLESEPDDDSDHESNPKHPIPDWATSSARIEPLEAQSYVPKAAVMRLFNTRRCTPDLSQLFEGISKHRLKRTSSAIWKSPPRYLLMVD